MMATKTCAVNTKTKFKLNLKITQNSRLRKERQTAELLVNVMPRPNCL